MGVAQIGTVFAFCSGMNDIPFPQRLTDKLLKRRGRLRDMLRRQTASILAEHNVGDFADGAVESDEASANSRITAAEHRELSLINQALDRLHAGQYGLCEECGHAISFERLKYLPYVTLCIECQRNGEVSR